MPQLDFVTMFSQLFWLFIIFMTFYVIVGKNLLPAIVQVKKARNKRLQQGNQQLDDLASERANTTLAYEEKVLKSLAESRILLNKTVVRGDEWLINSTHELNKTLLSSSNVKYLNTLGNIVGKRHLLKNLI